MSDFVNAWNRLAEMAHQNMVRHGFWEEDRTIGDLTALLHSECTEFLEAYRDGNPASDKIPHFTSAEEELADIVLRVMDTAAARNLDVGNAIMAKHGYNLKRPPKHGKEF